MELIKTTTRVGNSAGVLLPKKWLNTQVKVTLEPLNLEKDILEILLEKDVLGKTLGAYIVGSYARGEASIESDVDVLVITSGLNKKIVSGKYEILCISEEEVKRQLKKNALPLLAMIREAKTIINKSLLKSYELSLSWKNVKFHIETAKSAMAVVKKDLALSKELGESASDASAYSLVLRLRTLYILDCMKKGKLWRTKTLISLIKKVTGSSNAYGRYLAVKDKDTSGYNLDLEEAEKLLKYINSNIEKVEKWLKGKRG